ncbi:hypothetical protein CAOG_01532 [Capsaspora owczarzaki ATCC 30864]|uniref:Uncharacterized protein n=1 Tax=Capsaspora owczarzaki (strain ATCC 30864) TaxID=595528 RepID=A0A0D2VJN0_CAPO3|nr:hypothetical protein CAOG_01532 [Capsaspora owczarzaki ATCC 30864]KJE90187.1 hypothetical protein CAOG_001532 [Capsaspora owczarzaki ATCC 30864]|eukprot:XP_004364400.1 hypothetical protein CAOG_01532 [Capsaspora owczarzaki ATCC 30864]
MQYHSGHSAQYYSDISRIFAQLEWQLTNTAAAATATADDPYSSSGLLLEDGSGAAAFELPAGNDSAAYAQNTYAMQMVDEASALLSQAGQNGIVNDLPAYTRYGRSMAGIDTNRDAAQYILAQQAEQDEMWNSVSEEARMQAEGLLPPTQAVMQQRFAGAAAHPPPPLLQPTPDDASLRSTRKRGWEPSDETDQTDQQPRKRLADDVQDYSGSLQLLYEDNIPPAILQQQQELQLLHEQQQQQQEQHESQWS